MKITKFYIPSLCCTVWLRATLRKSSIAQIMSFLQCTDQRNMAKKTLQKAPQRRPSFLASLLAYHLCVRCLCKAPYPVKTRRVLKYAHKERELSPQPSTGGRSRSRLNPFSLLTCMYQRCWESAQAVIPRLHPAVLDRYRYPHKCCSAFVISLSGST